MAWRWRRTTGYCLVLALFGLGVTLFQMAMAPRLATHDVRRLLPRAEPLLCEGRVIRPAERLPTSIRLLVALTACRAGRSMRPTVGRVALQIPVPRPGSVLAPQIVAGARVRFAGRLKLPHGFQNPGTATQVWQRRGRGIEVQGWLEDATWLRVIAPPRGIAAWLERWRAAVHRSIAGGLSPEVGALVRAVVMGEGAELDAALWDRFRRIGAVHLLVVSGLNVAVVSVGIIAILGWLSRRWAWGLRHLPMWSCTMIIALAMIWAYVALVGSQIPALRAGILVSCCGFARLCQRYRDLPSAIALSALILLLHEPLALWSPSFQLTFAAVLALILWPLPAGLDFDPGRRVLWRALRWAWQAIWTSTSVTIAVFPILAWHFPSVSLMGVVTNLLFIPLIAGVLTPLGMLLLILAPCAPWLAHLLAVPIAWCGRAILVLSEWMDRASGPWQMAYTPTSWEIALWYGLAVSGLVWGWTCGHRRWRRGWVLGLLVVGLATLHARGLGGGEPALRVHIVDVGQGSAAVVQFPNGRIYVIDGGGSVHGDFDVGARVLEPVLRRLQIPRVHVLVLTHYHPDHYGGLAYLAERDHPLLYVNGSQAALADPLWPAVAARLHAAFVPTQVLTRGAAWREGEVMLRVLHPPPGPWLWGENDRSIVLELSYRALRILFAGDVEQAAERELLRTGDLRPVQIMTAPHHGSATSSSAPFLAALQPQVAIISCGYQNRYRFPRPEVLARYQRQGTEIYRTDLQGMVSIVSDGRRFTVRTQPDR